MRAPHHRRSGAVIADVERCNDSGRLLFISLAWGRLHLDCRCSRDSQDPQGRSLRSGWLVCLRGTALRCPVSSRLADRIGKDADLGQTVRRPLLLTLLFALACAPAHQPFSVALANASKERVTVRVRFDRYDSGVVPLQPGMEKTEMGIEMPLPREMTVEIVRPSGRYVTHGTKRFAADLRPRGIRAEFLQRKPQMRLF
jgi:hypothetical protein